LKSVQVQTN